MKQFINKISGAVLLFALFLSSCTKDFKEINTDPNKTTTALPQQLLAPALVNIVTYNMIRNRNFNNELMQVTVDMNDSDGRVFRYDFNNTWADYLYNNWYIQLSNLKDLYRVAADTTGPNYNKTYMAISLICQSWVYSMLTDAYGDVPYFNSNKGRDSVIYEPAFDRQKDIYLDIFKQLETANTLLTGAADLTVTASDPIYGGKASLWRKFCNTLYLRLLLRISGKTEVASDVIAKFQQIVGDNVTYPLINSNAESAILKWTGVAPYVNPYVTGVREQDFRAPGIASFFIDHLVSWDDPRLNISLGANGINRWGIAQSSEGFKGVPSGYLPGQGGPKKSYFYSNTSTTSMQTDALAGMILNFAELKFMLAEAVVKGWITGSAETYYNDGAKNSITLWMPAWAVDIKTFLTNADIPWDDTLPLEDKMEKIHLLKYYALFLTDLQQWVEYRRTGHPVLPKGNGLSNGGVMPARFNYPLYVQSANPTNYKLAVAVQGPDVISTEVWWQKK
ncbi:SusD/RagB family nutrient-binding outer membrane lipoprotein [uncultured Chitinophaga sp.]|uniref:SusD/RagB family nutrient-binding outer membrane lipoprotein n=1 Tax=uncultured Chitinophaga sp. TaxID=339340 RepID=UPI0025FC8383|nr:SusD/RagB family nutrient-binding outer membrane lipoprotein [uncultured Chitinophaga sp.]